MLDESRDGLKDWLWSFPGILEVLRHYVWVVYCGLIVIDEDDLMATFDYLVYHESILLISHKKSSILVFAK